MLTAMTRAVSSAIVDCEISFIPREPINLEKTRVQHRKYEEGQEKLGARIISLPEKAERPGSMLAEDPAIVLEELAVICNLGTETRRKEVASLANALEKFRMLKHIKLPGTLEGGDVLRIGKKVFVGLTERSNAEGIRQLAALLGMYGYDVTAVPVTGCLHLKSAVTLLRGNTLLGNREWFDWKRLEGFDWVDVDPGEPHAGNALAIGEAVVFPASFPRTREKIVAQGFRVEPLDISELQKAESGLTCSSLLFQS